MSDRNVVTAAKSSRGQELTSRMGITHAQYPVQHPEAACITDALCLGKEIISLVEFISIKWSRMKVDLSDSQLNEMRRGR